MGGLHEEQEDGTKEASTTSPAAFEKPTTRRATVNISKRKFAQPSQNKPFMPAAKQNMASPPEKALETTIAKPYTTTQNY